MHWVTIRLLLAGEGYQSFYYSNLDKKPVFKTYDKEQN